MKRCAPATARNRAPIAAVLAGVLPASGTVLEIASGTGEHAVFLARRFPQLRWQTSDPDADARESIAAWREAEALPNLRAPIALDAAAAYWPIDRADAICCINMVHISAWAATLGLLAGSARLLPMGAALYLYGPYRQAGVATAPSNEAFDRWLKNQCADWGLRELDAVVAAGADCGLTLDRVVAMPANNLSVILRRR